MTQRLSCLALELGLYLVVDLAELVHLNSSASNFPGNRSGNSPGNSPGNRSGNSPGNSPGNRSGNSPGNRSGNSPGNSPGNRSGNSPGNRSGNFPGNSHGNSSGNSPGNSWQKEIGSSSQEEDFLAFNSQVVFDRTGAVVARWLSGDFCSVFWLNLTEFVVTNSKRNLKVKRRM